MVFDIHLFTFIQRKLEGRRKIPIEKNLNFTLSYQIKIVLIGSFFVYPNLLSTSKPWQIWCFKQLYIILVIAITYLTILFHPEATICSFFVPYDFFLHVDSFTYRLFLCHMLYSWMLKTQFFIIFVFNSCFMLMFDVLTKCWYPPASPCESE